MKKSAWPILLLLLFALGLAGCGDSEQIVGQAPVAPTQSWIPPDPALVSNELQSVVDRALALNHVPGALVGVFTPNGSWTSATGLGDVANGRAISFGDASSWRSITKSFTVTIVMQLAAEGRVDLDGPVGRYVQGVPGGDKITLRQLANMTSGLFNYTTDETFLGLLVADLNQAFTDQELLGFAFSHPVNFAPGSDYEYSNTNTVLLGVVAESVTGLDIEQLYQTRIFTPLALSRTVYVTGTLLPSPFVHGYAYDPANRVFEEVVVNNTALGPAGGMAGTFDDLLTWGRALVTGTLLPADLQAQRFVSRPATNGPIYDSYGLGLGEIGHWWGHTGDALGYQAAVFTEPRSGSSIVIMLNAANENHDVPVDITREFQRVLGWTGS